jgi:hypothetical protein
MANFARICADPDGRFSCYMASAKAPERSAIYQFRSFGVGRIIFFRNPLEYRYCGVLHEFAYGFSHSTSPG